MRIVCLLFKDPKYINEIAEACYRWTPQIAIRPGEGIFLEIERCHRLYREETLLLRLQSVLKRFKTHARIAVTDDVFMSLAWAQFSPQMVTSVFDAERNKELPLEALMAVASPFKTDPHIEKNVSEMIKNLRRLGLATLGDFLELSPKELTSRFQQLGLELHRRLQNGGFDESLSLWPRFVPPDQIEEIAFVGDQENATGVATGTVMSLLFLIKSMGHRALLRLAGRGERATQVKLKLTLEKYSTVKNTERSFTFDLPLSQGAINGILPIIRERLNFDLQRDPLPSPVESIEFKITETVPGQYFQRHFFSKKEEEQEAWNSLMMRLCERLGRHCQKDSTLSTFVASPVERYRPEGAWRRTLLEKPTIEKEIEGVELPLPLRPLRLLSNPERLRKTGNALLSLNTGQTHHWEICDWEGPKRLSGEWWGEEFRREYFRIGTESGEQLWVYRIPESDHLYLHGYFD